MSFLRLFISAGIVAIWMACTYGVAHAMAIETPPDAKDWINGCVIGAILTVVTLFVLWAVYAFAGEVEKELS